MFVRCYLRASTLEQSADRAKEETIAFVKQHDHKIAGFYVENESGTKAARPELERLLNDSHNGDVLLIEKMDRLTRLPYQQWQTLKSRIQEKGLTIVVLDQPMTHLALGVNQPELSAIQQALTSFMLDLGAAMARDDYETRQKRQAQGIAQAKAEGKYKGKQINIELHKNIKTMLTAGLSYTDIQKALKCSRATIARVKKIIMTQT
ncbi:MAG: recombinase family protein [Gammaproteobacteria bacterium]|nr:recombinase family protein [Gammaproteobacteria bacterium]